MRKQDAKQPQRSRTIGEVGEFGVIDEIRKVAPSKRNGDDAAVLTQTTPNARYVASTDMVVEGRHFNRNWSTPQQIGHKAAIQNFADIESMGARPTAMLFAFSAPEDTPLNLIVGIAEGLWSQGKHCAAELVGGDITAGENLVISITALGELGGPMHALTRGGARVGDNVIVSGNIGYSAAGLALIESFGSPDAVPEQFERLVLMHLQPEFEYGRGTTARAAGASSLTDNSDGFIVDCSSIAKASHVNFAISSAEIAPDALLIEAGQLLNVDPWDWVLTGGEDHSLLGTTPMDAPTGFRTIGKVIRRASIDRGSHVLIDGAEPTKSAGWVAF